MDEDGRERLPQKTTPTWEMELLVSGATIFGLLQLPEFLDLGYFRAMNVVPGTYAFPLMYLWLYSKIAVVVLVITFVAHLCLRGYWVAIVGMNSVYPDGIRWDKFELGPLARERHASLPPTQQMAEAIERADNRATRVFGAGVSVAMIFVTPVALVLAALLAGVLTQAFIGEHWIGWAMIAVIAAWVVPRVLLSYLDKRFGASIQRSPRLKRGFDAVGHLYTYIGTGPRNNPLLALFASHVGRRRFAAMVMAVLAPVILTMMWTSRGQMPFGLFGGWPGANRFAANSAPAAFYRDENADPREMLPPPHIPSRVVQGAYLELFVPFVPRLHGEALTTACPKLRGTGGGEREPLDCLARVLAIKLDGVPVNVPFDATTDPANREQGVLAMIPVATLAPGRHEISLNEPENLGFDGEPARRYRIPFWK
jgi:hypothetical protein